jgi:hypothetical protein
MGSPGQDIFRLIDTNYIREKRDIHFDFPGDPAATFELSWLHAFPYFFSRRISRDRCNSDIDLCLHSVARARARACTAATGAGRQTGVTDTTDRIDSRVDAGGSRHGS